MSGTPQQPNPQQPYGNQGEPQPQWQPPVAKAPKGSVSTKVWGIILLILGAIGLLMLIMNVASILGGGMNASTFSVNMSEEAQQELNRVGQMLVDSALHRWSFWTNTALEVVIALVSLVAGFKLAIRPKPGGRKLAIARALIVFAALPIYGYESITATEESMTMVSRMQEIQVQDMLGQQEKMNPSKDAAERDRRQKEVKEQIQAMQPFMKGAAYGTVVLMAVAILVINALLLFFMTRPTVKEYLEAVASEGDSAIPGYDPSMGMMGPPPGAAAPPGNQPPPSEPPTEEPPKAD